MNGCPLAGALPSETALRASGVQEFGAEVNELSKKGEGEASGGAQSSLVQLGVGLPALQKKLVDKIEAGEYVDFNELPPAKGKGRLPSQALEGQVLVVQAADLVQSRRIIPDLATWMQCCGLLTAVVTRKKPEKAAELIAYMSLIAKASQKYKWPSWVIYDQNFRMEVAGDATQSWAKVEPGLYAQCFTGQARSIENWCSTCQGIDHASIRCPFKTQKRSWSAAFGQPGKGAAPTPTGAVPTATGAASTATGGVCWKFNRYDGDCRYGPRCRFSHACSSCGGAHPAQRCKADARKNMD